MTFPYLLVGGGILSLLSAVVTGIFCGSIYCTAPDVFSYASGEAVRKELLCLPRSTITLLGCSLYLSGLGIWAAGPTLTTVAGLPLYAMIIIFFVAGFAFSSYDHQIPLPEMVTGPFLVLAMVHNFPDLAGVGASAMAIAMILFFRCLFGLTILVVLTLSSDALCPRMYGIITDDTWLFLAGAAAWVGVGHLLGLFMCLAPLFVVSIVWLQLAEAQAANEANRRVGSMFLPRSQATLVIPWGAIITMALLFEMILRHEFGVKALHKFLTPFIATSF
jgi:hypothetical protein